MPTVTRTAASLVAIVAAFALVLYLVYDGDGDPSATPTPTVAARSSPAPTAAPTPEPPPVLEGARLKALRSGEPVGFPDGTALVMETGCWQCPDGPTGLRRTYKDPLTGDLLVEQLLAIEELGVANADAYITGIAVAPHAAYMIASVCVRGECPYWHHSWSEDARTSLFESRDGGVTWRKVAEYDLALAVEGLVGPETALVSWYQEAPPAPRLHGTYPGLEPVTPPGDDYFPVLNIGPEVAWRSSDEPGRLVRGDGSVFLDLGEGVGMTLGFLGPLSGPVPLQWTWEADEGPSIPRTFFSLVGQSGEIVDTHETHPAPAIMLSAVPYDDDALIGTMEDPPQTPVRRNFSGLVPVIVDLEGGRYDMIEEPFLEPGYEPGRDIVRAVQHGPFARVNIPGSCLNVREGPALVAAIVSCAGDGVLLQRDDVTAVGDDTTWLRVTTPRGVEGWAAVAFLEY